MPINSGARPTDDLTRADKQRPPRTIEFNSCTAQCRGPGQPGGQETRPPHSQMSWWGAPDATTHVHDAPDQFITARAAASQPRRRTAPVYDRVRGVPASDTCIRVRAPQRTRASQVPHARRVRQLAQCTHAWCDARRAARHPPTQQQQQPHTLMMVNTHTHTHPAQVGTHTRRASTANCAHAWPSGTPHIGAPAGAGAAQTDTPTRPATPSQEGPVPDGCCCAAATRRHTAPGAGAVLVVL
jgi:hypothetical protein